MFSKIPSNATVTSDATELYYVSFCLIVNFKILIKEIVYIIVPRWWRPPDPGRSKNRDQGYSRGVPDSSTIISCSTIIL